MKGAIMAKDAGPARLLRWCGLALGVAGVLMAVATLLHPSHETATTIIASEVRLVAAHATYTLSWLLVLLGLGALQPAGAPSPQPSGSPRSISIPANSEV